MTHLDGNALAGLFADTVGIDHRRDRTMRKLSSDIRTRTRPRLRHRYRRGPAMRALPGHARRHRPKAARSTRQPVGAGTHRDCTALSRPPMPLRPALRRDRPSPRCCPATQGEQCVLHRILENRSIVVYLGHHQPALHGGDD